MQIPKSMITLAGAFHQDLLLIADTPDGIANYAVGHLSPEEASEALAFLEKLLDGTYSRDEIKSVWNAMPVDVRIDDGAGVQALLEHVRIRLVSRQR